MSFQYSIRWQEMDPENAGSDGEYRDIELEDYLATLATRTALADQAQGIVGFAEATASAWSNATTTASDITASTGTAPSLTLALDPLRLYLATFTALVASTSAGDRIFLLFDNGATVNLQSFTATTVTLQAQYAFRFSPASSASTTYKMQGRQGTGAAGTVSVSVGATSQMQFAIEDLGVAP